MTTNERLGNIVRLHSARITTIIGLAGLVIGTGFLAGCSPGSSNAQPTKTVTATVTAKPSVASTASTPGSSDSSSPAASGSPDASGTASTVQSAPDGRLLGSYTVDLPSNGVAPLGVKAPTQAQVIAGTNWDVQWSGNGNLYVGNGDTMVSLPDGAKPTYQSCKADTVVINAANGVSRVAFCVVEGDAGLIAGVKVTAVNSSDVVLQVQVWSNSS
jgi:hypothetical protein